MGFRGAFVDFDQQEKQALPLQVRPLVISSHLIVGLPVRTKGLVKPGPPG
jgi:hypothetical protein